MKIFKGQYGFSTSAFSKNKEDGTENKLYINVQYKKGTEPNGETIEGELYFKSKEGEERKCFLSSYKKKDGTVSPKLIIMEPVGSCVNNEYNHNSVYSKQSPTVNGEEIESDYLPFY